MTSLDKCKHVTVRVIAEVHATLNILKGTSCILLQLMQLNIFRD